MTVSTERPRQQMLLSGRRHPRSTLPADCAEVTRRLEKATTKIQANRKVLSCDTVTQLWRFVEATVGGVQNVCPFFFSVRLFPVWLLLRLLFPVGSMIQCRADCWLKGKKSIGICGRKKKAGLRPSSNKTVRLYATTQHALRRNSKCKKQRVERGNSRPSPRIGVLILGALLVLFTPTSLHLYIGTYT